MSKLILKPGNGINFPKQGEYVKLEITVKTKNDEVLFSSNKAKNTIIRMGNENSNFLEPIIGLINEMSLFEKCSIEFAKENLNEYKEFNLTDELINLINKNDKILFEIEILAISSMKL